MAAEQCKEVKICGMVWTVRRLPRDHADLDGALGLTRVPQCDILLAVGQSREALVDTYFHEVLHAWMASSGTRQSLELATRLPDDQADKVEEMLVRLMSASLRPALEAAGWTPPKSPGRP